MEPIRSGVTHPETAWLIGAVPVALAVLAVLVVAALLRERLLRALAALQVRRADARRGELPPALLPDEALVWVPPSVPTERTLLICAGVALALLTALALAAPLYLALALCAPLTALAAWALSRASEGRYVARLDRDLVPALGRLQAALRSGSSYRQAVERIVVDLPDCPLRDEWRFLLDREGAPLLGGAGIATAPQVAAALAAQTPSRRHATLLNHLAVAVGQPQEVLAARVAAAYAAMQASERRREEAVTELAQMRYSGVFIGLAGLGMGLYLALTQWERMALAYGGAPGAIAATLVVSSLLLPIVGGLLLARADDVDY